MISPRRTDLAARWRYARWLHLYIADAAIRRQLTREAARGERVERDESLRKMGYLDIGEAGG